MSQSQSKQNITAIAIVAIVALLCLNAYQWYTNDKLSKINDGQTAEMVELRKTQAELEQEYASALESLEEMRGENGQLNALIDSQKEELRVQKEKINNLIWTKKELDKAKTEIKNLGASVTKYLAEIEQLKEENQILSTNNRELSEQIKTEVAAKEAVMAEKSNLISEKETLSKTNTELGSKVDMANAIKINYLEVKGYEVKSDGKLKEKSKGKDIDLLRVCLLTETNMVTPAGTKKFFVRIINPQGETVAVEDQGSGVLMNKLDNTQVRYTMSGDVTYKNEDTNACIDWKASRQLPKGDYSLEVYNNGYPVGKGTFKIK